MNRLHARLCSSPEWGCYLASRLLPGVLDGLDLGPSVLELGPGYGAATRVLAGRTAALTAIENDRALAARLRAEFGGSVQVVDGDATELPFDAATFSAVVCCTMLHHLESPAAQDRLLAEAARVLAPGGVLAGTDSRSRLRFRLYHLGDICTPVDPRTLPGRLARAGFTRVRVQADQSVTRFVGYAPSTEGGPVHD